MLKRIVKIRILLFIFSFVLFVSSCEINKEKVDEQIIFIDSLNNSIEVENDTKSDIISPRGIQILFGSRNAYYVNELAGLWLKSIALTECLNEGEPNGEKHHQISEIIKTDTSLSIEFFIFETCGSDFLCDVNIVNENTLDLIYLQYNSLADCRCCFGIEYNFLGLSDPLGYYDIKYITFNGKDRVAFNE